MYVLYPNYYVLYTPIIGVYYTPVIDNSFITDAQSVIIITVICFVGIVGTIFRSKEKVK